MNISFGPKLKLINNAAIGQAYPDQFRVFLRFIDAIVQGSVLNTTTTAPPASPNDGDAYLLLGTPTGAWAGKQNAIAVYSLQITLPGSNVTSPGWDFWTPNDGWKVFDLATSRTWTYAAGVWTLASITGDPTSLGSVQSGAYDSWTFLAGLHGAGGLSVPFKAVTASYAVLASDHTVAANATSGAVTLTLPDASTVFASSFTDPSTNQSVSIASGGLLVLKKTDASENYVTVTPAAGQTIDGEASYTLTVQNQHVMLHSNGSGWTVIGQSLSKAGFYQIPFAATVTVDWSIASTQKITLTGDTTISFANAAPGTTLRLIVAQDATGSHNVTWDSHILGVYAVGLNASTSSLYHFIYDTTNYLLDSDPITNQ